MKIKVHRSRVSTKSFKKLTFPRYSRKELTKDKNKESSSITKLSLERAAVSYTEPAVAGYYAINNFKDITGRMRSEPEKFGRCLNKLITTFYDIVVSDNGVIDKFLGTGALFTFKYGSKPKVSVQKALIAALKMRYILNKLNREWGFYHEDTWRVGFGVNSGDMDFTEHPDEAINTPEGRTYRYVTLSGKPGIIARGIGQSAGSSQVLLTDLLYLQFPFLETAFEIKPPRHVPVRGESFVIKIREIVGMVGPQAKKIYEVYV